MGVARMLRPWRRQLQETLPDLHGHQIKALATASLAMSLAQHCQLTRLASLTPDDVQPTLLTDRGLAWPAVVDACARWGWHFVLRVQGQTQVRLADGSPRAIATLASRKGALWRGRAQVFKKAGWRTVNVVACWPHDVDEPWLLISDLPPTRGLCRRYRQRMRQEQSFRDEKSHGFQRQQSRVREPAHADRLLLIMALAMTWLIELGLRLIKQGRRAELERRDRRTLSVFQLALRYLSRWPATPGLGVL